MTELRDARLVRALEHAPDARALPGDASRRAILAAAHAAVAPATVAPWWRRWWGGDGRQRMPWSAALASVLLASLVTVLWYDREVPDAAPQAPRMEAPASQPAPPPPSSAPAPKSVAPAPAQTQRKRLPESAPAVREAQDQALAKSAPAQAEEARRADMAVAQAQAPAAAPPTAAAMPAPRAAAAPAAPAMRSQFAGGWTHLRIDIDGRRLELPREQAARLADLLDSMAATARDAQPLEGAVVARIETLRGGEPHGVLELAPPRIRWSARGGTALTGQPDAAQLQQLQGELARLVSR
jgi:hypothetical protein